MKDLHILPKVRDSWSYLYVEHCRIDQDGKAIAIHDARGKVPIPCATLTLLMLGPGTSITHAAVKTLAESGCLVLWTGEIGVRFYAQGMGETRSSRNLLRQARLWADKEQRLQVVLRMYRMRFKDVLDEGITLQQIRGREGLRVRETYARTSRETGIVWSERSYRRDAWEGADPINRAISSANSCLYGVCHAAIVSAGYSPALGFVHTGKMLSFVYDIADLYKTEVTIPVAFRIVAEASDNVESRIRRACRDAFREQGILDRIVPDIESVLGPDDDTPFAAEEGFDEDAALPGGLWDPVKKGVPGGVNAGDSGGGSAGE